MKNTKFFYINKLSQLHNGKTIFFCKTDYILEDFNIISKLNNNVIFITGNSDYSINDDITNLAPKNIIKWYAQNALSYNEILEPIPIGLENRFPSSREGHGIGYYDRVKNKEDILQKINTNNQPNKFIYANFNINTNINYRYKIKEICLNTPFITWQEPNLLLDTFYSQIIDHKMVLCPIGNGVDTHRLWETLYSNRIPIIIKIGNYKIYELYKKLPIIILDNILELKNLDLIMSKYYQAINKDTNHNMLYIDYWFAEIQKAEQRYNL